MYYKYDSKEYIVGITKIVSVNKKICSRQKEIGRDYFSEIDRAGQGIPSENIGSDKVNKLYLVDDNTPRLVNKFFFYKGDVITIYTFEKYGFTFSKFGVCSLNGKTMKCSRYYESGIEKSVLVGRLIILMLKGIMSREVFMFFKIKMVIFHLLRLKIEIIKKIRCYLIDTLREPNDLSILVSF